MKLPALGSQRFEHNSPWHQHIKVHNNFYFLRQLTNALGTLLTGSVVSECFSQSKDELIIRFEIGPRTFVIRASLLPELGCLSFPENFHRARKNSVDLLTAMVGKRVEGIRQFRNERSFAVKISDGYDLLFKMHGNRTNVLLFENGLVIELFRKNLIADAGLKLEARDRDIDWSYQHFLDRANDLRSSYFTFGKVVWRYLEECGFSSKDLNGQWQSIQELLVRLDNPTYYITLVDSKPVLSLLETGEVKKIIHDPLTAANEYFHTFTQLYVFAKEKALLMQTLRSRLEAGQNYWSRNSARLAQIREDDHYRLWGDLIMTHLHAIHPGTERVMLNNFYDDGQPVEIKLKKDLSAQKNADIYYKKAKNQHIEIERLESALRQKEDELRVLREKLAEAERASDLKSLRLLEEQTGSGASVNRGGLSLPYYEFIFRDFRIWVGKNATSNDILTLKHSHKDDLWLHAKDVAGSHVVIKHQSGKSFPKDVIEYAASLAAANSKRKNESLCPVVVTPKKFVRKRKGDPPGMVVVEREEVVMVEPARMN